MINNRIVVIYKFFIPYTILPITPTITPDVNLFFIFFVNHIICEDTDFLRIILSLFTCLTLSINSLLKLFFLHLCFLSNRYFHIFLIPYIVSFLKTLKIYISKNLLYMLSNNYIPLIIYRIIQIIYLFIIYNFFTFIYY